MNSLRTSLVEMLDASSSRALVDAEKSEGREALARVVLLMGLIERLDSERGAWDDCRLLPEVVPVLMPGEGHVLPGFC